MTISRRQVGALAFLAFGCNRRCPLLPKPTMPPPSPRRSPRSPRRCWAPTSAKLESLVSDQLSYGHSGGVIQDKKDFVDVIATKKTVYKSIELSASRPSRSPATTPSCATPGKARAAPATASGTSPRSACCRSGRRSRAGGSFSPGRHSRCDAKHHRRARSGRRAPSRRSRAARTAGPARRRLRADLSSSSCASLHTAVPAVRRCAPTGATERAYRYGTAS